MFRLGLMVTLLCTIVGIAQSLDPYEKFQEGSCSKDWVNGQPNIDRSWLDTLNYIPAGSRYHLYRIASRHPNYPKMTESELIAGMCFRRNTSTTNGRGGIIAFRRLISSFNVVTLPDEPWVYLEAIPKRPSARWETLKEHVTLTDRKTFAFILSCWTGSNQRVWHVISLSPQLNPETTRLIKDHAASLGFRRENMVFLRYDSCRKESPLQEH